MYNRAQGEDLARKGKPYLEMFRGMGPGIAAALEGVELVAADEHYDGGSHIVDLGGKTVELRTWGRAHTNGDQVAFVREDAILFAGDLAEERTFPIFPWFPPDDVDIDADGWVRALDACLALRPKIVVPGHGDVGGPEILTAVREYIVDVGNRVAEARASGMDEAQMVATIAPEVRALHPEWHFPEWIDFAIRYFAETRRPATP